MGFTKKMKFEFEFTPEEISSIVRRALDEGGDEAEAVLIEAQHDGWAHEHLSELISEYVKGIVHSQLENDREFYPDRKVPSWAGEGGLEVASYVKEVFDDYPDFSD